MNDHAYDITHLLDLETLAPNPVVPPARVIRTERSANPPVDRLDIVLERELQQAAAAHEALVEDYLRGGTIVIDSIILR